MTFRSRSPLSHEASVPQRPPGVVVQDAGIAGSCSQSRLSSQRGAARRALGAIATAQGDAEAAGSGERRGRRGEGRCHAKGERRGQAGAKDGMSQAPGVQPNQQPSVYHERQRLELCAVHALNNVLQQQLFNQEAADEICKSLLRQRPAPQSDHCGIYSSLSQGSGKSFTPRMCWRSRDESPVLGEARETDIQKSNTHARPFFCPASQGPRSEQRLAPDSRLNPHRSLLGTGNYDVNVIMAALQGLGLAAVWWDRRRPLSQLALPQVLGLILNLPSPVSLGLLSLPLRRRHWVALRQVNGIYYNLDSKLRAPEPLGDEDGVRAFLEAALAQGLCEVLLVVTKEVEEKGCWLRAG
ncbi:josephin-2 isoform X3 [Nycticebus coucang]|uniref:josephin-2 isoform X3 n=1 Tax=Nycticebus coucang TaxID=9470 RepID=UPI00234D270A|nr:josephin-2 isoform X3 [Nycticebus coucang]